LAYKNKTTTAQDKFLRQVKWILIGDLAGVFVCSTLLCVFAFVFVKIRNIPGSLIDPIAVICASAGSLVSGYVSVLLSKQKGIFYGLASGLFLFLVLLFIGITVANEPFTFFSLIKLFAMLLCGAVGGIIRVNKRAH
jgi:putative membrane protein (TIGR04086 family)